MSAIRRGNNQVFIPSFLFAICLSALTIPRIAIGQTAESPWKSKAEALISEYTDCVTNWAGQYLNARATPTETTEAAQSKCLREIQAFEEEQKKYLLSITPPGITETRAIDKAKAITSDVREMTKAHIIRLIIETRSDR